MNAIYCYGVIPCPFLTIGTFHQIEREKVEKPLIDINVMAALPTRAQMEERAAVEVTVG